jgi:glycosyltransferase involved in cell wall biosynthesis
VHILHVTNLVGPHQLPLARQLAAAVGENHFRLAAMLPTSPELQKRGWRNDEADSWILSAAENEAHRSQYEQWWNEADVVICGYRNVDGFANRVRRGKLTFYMSERWWKPPLGIARLLHPRFAWMAARFRRLARSRYLHFLPMGGYAGTDIRRIASFQGRTWDWGYFTALPDPLPPCRERDETLRVLWAGRMLAWKRIDSLVRAFDLLLRQDPMARLTLIGDGPCRPALERLARTLGIVDSVVFRSTMLAPQVRQQMRNAHVYVLPSNAYEGWGAVLNEAMSEGCAVVASEAAGAARTMLRHGENGLLFTPGDYKRLGALLLELRADESLRLRLAEAGQCTIAEEWSPQVAAERFLAVSDACLSRRPTPVYSSGPMCPAWLK